MVISAHPIDVDWIKSKLPADHKFVGLVGVDSGKLMVVDPSYIHDKDTVERLSVTVSTVAGDGFFAVTQDPTNNIVIHGDLTTGYAPWYDFDDDIIDAIRDAWADGLVKLDANGCVTNIDEII